MESVLAMDRQQLFQRMVDDYYEPLLSYAHFLLGCKEQVEDVVHQAFMLGFDRLANGRLFRGDPGKWLRGTVRNLVCEVWRRNRKLPQDVADLLQQVVAQADEAGDAMDRSSLSAALRRCLERLEEADRELIGQRYENGWRVTEIARRMQVSASTLRVRLFRVRQGLKSCVEAQLSGEAPT